MLKIRVFLRNFVKVFVSFLVFLTFFDHRINADNVIVMPLKHAPEEIRRDVEAEYKSKWDPEKFAQFDQATPAEMSQKFVKNGIKKFLTPSLGGFMVIYGGYVAISDQDGLVTFPLRHSSNKIYLAVTPEIKLVKVKENTFSHAEYIINEKNEVKLYQFEKKEDEKKQIYWDVKEIPLPTDRKIDPITMIILSKPRNIFVPQAHVMAEKTDQIVLPEVYVLGNADKEAVLLNALEIKRYFETIKIKQKKISDTAVQKIITNI